MGSLKLMILTKDFQQVGSTGTCVRRFGHITDPGYHTWNALYYRWMTETYIPIIVMRAMKDKRWQKKNDLYVVSRDKLSILVSGLNSPQTKTWLSKSKVHPKDWDEAIKNNNRCISIRIPEWLAIKAGMI